MGSAISGATQAAQQAANLKAQPQATPGMKGGAIAPGQITPGGKGQPQPTPGMKGGSGPTPGNKGSAPGGKGGISQPTAPGSKSPGAPVNAAPGGKGAGQPMPGSKGMPPGQMQGQQVPPQLGQLSSMMQQGAGQPQQPMPGGKGAGQMDPRMLQQQAPGGKGSYQQPGMQQGQQPQQYQDNDQQHGQVQQPFHNAMSNDYNVQGGARMNTPYSAPGTNGSPAAFGMHPANAGFGYGNGATRVPDTDHLTAGQFNPAIHPSQQSAPQPTAQAQQNQAFRGLPMYQQGQR